MERKLKRRFVIPVPTELSPLNKAKEKEKGNKSCWRHENTNIRERS